MVICRYCGQKNRTGDLRCSNCGKPLSLLPNDQPDPILEKDQIKSNDLHEKTIRRDSIKWKYINLQNNQKKGSDNYSDNIFNQNDHGEDELYRTKFHENIGQYKDNNLDYSHYKKTETLGYFIEWDVIIASSLIAIILTAIFNKIFPIFGYVFALLISLTYLLIVTRNKNTLLLAIPLSFMTTSAISAFLSL